MGGACILSLVRSGIENLIIADNNFRENFPSISGSNIMLIDGQQENKQEINNIALIKLNKII